MAEAVVIIADSPDGNGRQYFTAPREIITAQTLDAVPNALREVEKRAAAGSFAIGYVSYDAAPAFDARLRVPGRSPVPLLWFAICDAPAADAPPESHAEHQPLRWHPHVARSEYETCVEQIKLGIRNGGFYQVDHTIRLHADNAGDPRARYEALRAAQPKSYGMFIDMGRFQILSVSPELFFARAGRTIETRPMKGTARRGRWPDEDLAMADHLRTSEKERAENVMIVDLMRNDLGRIAEIGSVIVPRLFDVERHATVWQMTSTITAHLRDDVSLVGIFEVLFPCGSVVGAPKIAAADWIADHEGAPRGVYCGAIGIVRPGGDCVFSVGIRTLVIDQDTGCAAYGTGGGITIDSTPSAEYDELLAKAAVLGGAPPEFELLETMRLKDGAYVRRARHVARMLASAAYFDFADPTTAVDAALDERAQTDPCGEHRVRLLLARDGSARTESSPIAPVQTGAAAVVRCAVASTAMSSQDVFSFHKTTQRREYDRRRSEHPLVDEIILVNERDELTECSIGNLVLEIDGVRYTPPIASGLLPGVFRDELIASGAVSERVLRQSDLALASRLWRVNSLREWVELSLVP